MDDNNEPGGDPIVLIFVVLPALVVLLVLSAIVAGIMQHLHPSTTMLVKGGTGVLGVVVLLLLLRWNHRFLEAEQADEDAAEACRVLEENTRSIAEANFERARYQLLEEFDGIQRIIDG
jgi:protein-S-isoprenylcysteine O-methyltransferase Ste14